MSVPRPASTLIPPLLLSCLLVVAGRTEVLQVGAVHEAAAVGQGDDVVDVGARDSQPVGGAVGTERVVAPDARAQLTIATMRARQFRLFHVSVHVISMLSGPTCVREIVWLVRLRIVHRMPEA